MYNTYVSSTVYSLCNKGHLCHSFGDYPIFSNERCNIHFLSSRSCCSCCVNYALPTCRVPRGPGISYGSRQSVLLQWSTSRRLILGGGNRFCYRVPEYGRDRNCCEVPCSITDSMIYHRSEGGKQRRCCMIPESNFEFHESNGFDEEEIAEAMISLIGEEYFGSQEKIRSSKREEVGNRGSLGGKERGLSSSKRVEREKRGRSSIKERNFSSFEKITVDRKRETDSQRCGGERKTNKLSSLNSKQNNKVGSITIESTKDVQRRSGGLLVHSMDDNQSLKKEGSSCSSYYSVSSSGDMENDAEIEDKNVQFVEESQNRNRYNSHFLVEEGSDEQVMEDLKRRDNEKPQGEDSVLGTTTVGTGVDWHWRKNSEKKLSEVSTEVTSSVRKTSEMNLRLSTTKENDSETTSSSRKKFIDEDEKLEMAVTLNEQSKQYDVLGKRADGVFINEGKKLAEVPGISWSNTEVVSCTHKRLSVKNENLEFHRNVIEEASNQKQETSSSVLEQKTSRSSSLSQQLAEASENKKIDTQKFSHQTRQSDAMISAAESKNVVVTSTQEIEERRHQTGKHIIGEAGSGQKILHLGVISVIKDGNTNTSALTSETRTKDGDQNATFINTSSPVNRDTRSQSDRKASQKILSRKGSRDAPNISVVHGTDKLSDRHSQKASKSRTFKEETNRSQVEKTFKETKKRHSQNIDQDVRIEFGREAEEKLNVQGSFNRISQTGYQGVGVNEEENRSSQAMLMPPPSQFVARDPLHADSTSEMASQVVSCTTSGSGSSASYILPGGSPALHHKSHRETGAYESTGEPVQLVTPDDALGSFNRSERSSTQFFGEFIEKSRNELLISEIQKDENNIVIDSSHEVKLDNQIKDHDSKHSSRSSGTKGPSDEMWHVTDSYAEHPPKAEDPEFRADIENAIVKRSGRTLWNTISDIIHLRWSSRAETSDSAVRSAGRISSNESASNETWFSGQEQEETNNTKVGENTSNFTSSDQLEHPNPSARSPDLSGGKKSENICTDIDMPSSQNITESKTLGENLLVSGEMKLKEGRKTIEVSSSGLDIEQSPLPLPPRGIGRSPIIEGVSQKSNNDAFSNSSMGPLELPHDATLPEISTTVTKDGELKQRKLQRNKQVLRDRFDEWEEAYIIETEQRKIDEMFMREALAEAKKAADTWEVPVGAVLVKDGKIIARGCNLVEELRDSTAHAEMFCIREASKLLKTWRLAETTLYVTLEPCPMCAGAILQARIENLVWGAPNKLLGADGSWIRLFPDGGEGSASEPSDKPAAPVHPFHPKMTIRRGVLASECADVMQQFFQLRRRKKVKKENTPPLTVAHHPSKFLTKMHNIFHMLFCL